MSAEIIARRSARIHGRFTKVTPRACAPFSVTICPVNMKALLSRRRLLGPASALLVVGVLGSARFVYPQDARNRGDQSASGGAALELLHIRGNVSMLAGAGANITVQVGNDGVLLVDSGAAPMTDKVLESIRTLSKGQVTYIVNTNDRSDHVGGNANFARMGRPLAIARAAQAR